MALVAYSVTKTPPWFFENEAPNAPEAASCIIHPWLPRFASEQFVDMDVPVNDPFVSRVQPYL